MPSLFAVRRAKRKSLHPCCLNRVIHEMLEDANQIPAEFDRLKGHHFLSVIPPSKSKEKPQKICVVCYKNKV